MWFTCIISLLSYFAINYFGLKEQYFVIDGKFSDFGEVSLGYLKIIDVLGVTNIGVDFEFTSVGQWI